MTPGAANPTDPTGSLEAAQPATAPPFGATPIIQPVTVPMVSHRPPQAPPFGVSPAPTQPVLEYGRSATADDQVRLLLARLGGLRQLVFAIGMACALGGFAYGLSSDRARDLASFWAAVGGGLIGLVVPLRRADG